MISKKGPVGIDIEQISKKVERIAPRFLNPDELASALHDQQKVKALYACWCAKEAVYKCNGQKEVSFADNIKLQPFTYEPEGSIQAVLHKDELKLNYTVQYLQYEDYMVGYVKGE
jgi:phosphopantetheine--protein transferase-like protein